MPAARCWRETVSRRGWTHSRALLATLGDSDTALRLRLLPLENELSLDDNDLASPCTTRLPIRVLYMEGPTTRTNAGRMSGSTSFLTKAFSEDGLIETTF